MTAPRPELDVRAILGARMPEYRVESIRYLGEGQENVAYVVNDELIVRFSKESDPAQRAARVRREMGVLAAVARVSPVPVPVTAFGADEDGCLAYFKVAGVPLSEVPRQARMEHAAAVATTLGTFLSQVHDLPVARMAELVDADDDTASEWLRDAAEAYPGLAARVPTEYRRPVEAFFDAPPPAAGYTPVFSHNDLGIEHVLVDPATSRITGIIDWSDAAIVDPAYDFGLIYRDLGPVGLLAAMGAYGPEPGEADSLRERAVFYARCSVFEDLAYGLETQQARFETRQARFVDNSLAALEWLFPAAGP